MLYVLFIKLWVIYLKEKFYKSSTFFEILVVYKSLIRSIDE